MADKLKFKEIGNEYIAEVIAKKLLSIRLNLEKGEVELAQDEFNGLVGEILRVKAAINSVGQV